MDEQEYKKHYYEINPIPCPFAKALLSGRCNCEKYQKLYLAERDIAACTQINAQITCNDILQFLYIKTRFALGIVDLAIIPHAKAMKIQCGSMLALSKLCKLSNSTTQVDNIYLVVQTTMQQYPHLENLPLAQLLQEVKQYRVRYKT
jgi:hypothetical protein